MIKHLTILLALCSCCYGQLSDIQYTQGSDGRYYPNNLVWDLGSDGRYYARISSGAVSAVYTNSLHEINMTLWSNSVAEYLFDTNNLSWTNNYNTSDSSYIGTNRITSWTGGNSYDPAWRASTNGAVTNGWYEFATDDYLKYALAPTNYFSMKGGGTIRLMAKNPTLSGDENAIAYNRRVIAGNGAGWNFYPYSSGYIYFQFYGDGGSGEAHKGCTKPIGTNWVHYVITWDGEPNLTNLKMYTNGAEIASYDFTADTVTTYTGTEGYDLFIGTLGGGGYWNGSIDAVTVATNIWTATQVTNDYIACTNGGKYLP